METSALKAVPEVWVAALCKAFKVPVEVGPCGQLTNLLFPLPAAQFQESGRADTGLPEK